MIELQTVTTKAKNPSTNEFQDVTWGGINVLSTSGTADYNNLTNKPTINGVTVQGSLTAGDLLITAADVGALPSGTKYGADFALTIDSQTFIVTAQLKDQDGNNLGQAKTIDLPLETMVVGGRYDDTTQKVILTLKNGQTVEFSVADLVNGLQSEITLNNKLDADLIDDVSSENKFVTSTEKSTWNDKQDTISDLATIRSGAAAGATALQQSDITSTYSSSGTAPVNGTAVNAAIETLDVSSVGGAGKVISAISETDGKISATETTMDTTPTANSTVPVTSGGVAESQAMQDAGIAWNVNHGVKNVIDIQHPSATKNTNYVTTSDGGVELSCSNATWTQYNIADIPVTSGSEYTFIFYVDTISGTDKLQVFVRDTDGSGTTLHHSVTISATGTYTATITPSASKIWVGIYLNNSATAKTASAKIRVMLCPAIIKDSTFQPYAKTNRELTVAEEEDRAALIAQVDGGAKNFLDTSVSTLKKYNTASSAVWNGSSYTQNGITYSVNSDGTISVSGTATSTSFLVLANRTYLNTKITRGRYSISGCPTGGGSSGATYRIFCLNPNANISNGYTDTGNGYIGEFYYDDSKDCNIAIGIGNGCVITDPLVFKPMICTAADWAVSQKFVPYCPTNRELYETKAEKTEIHDLLANITSSSTLTAYVDSLARGHYTSFIANTDRPTDVPVFDNMFVEIYIYSTNTALIRAFPTGTIYMNQFFQKSKIVGVWRDWNKFEGTVVT